MTIQFVGSATSTIAGATSGTTTVSLTSLSGGISSTAAAGDIVIAVYVTGSTVSRTLSITDGTTAYTAIAAKIYANSTADTNLQASYKIMGSTPDTTTTFGATGATADAGAVAVYVFRGVDQTTPLDVTPTTASGTTTGQPSPAAITPVSTGAVVVVCAGGAAATGATYTSSDLSSLATATSAGTTDAMVGVGYETWSSGAVTPATFGGGTTGGTDSYAAVTLALRPSTAAVTAPVLVQNSGATHYAAASSSSFTFASNPVVGNVLIIELTNWASGTPVVPTISDTYGHTWTKHVDVASHTRSTIWSTTVTSTGASFQVTCNFSATQYGAWAVQEWAGITQSAFDQSATKSTKDNNTSITAGPTGTLAVPDQLVIGMMGGSTGNAASGVTQPLGFTLLGVEQNSPTYIAAGMAYRTVSNTAPITTVWTFANSTTADHTTAVATFRLGSAGAASGSSTVAAAAIIIGAGAGAASGASTVSGVGTSTAASAGAAAGTSTVSGAGASFSQTGAGSAAGTATVSGAGAATTRVAGAAAGTSTVSGVGLGSTASVGAASGTSTVSGVGTATTRVAGAASGTSTVSGVGASTIPAVGAASGTSSVAAVGVRLTGAATTGQAQGTSSVAAVGRSIIQSTALASGTSAVAATSASTVARAGAATGTTTLDGRGAATTRAAGSAAGASTVSGVGTSYIYHAGAGSAAGTSSVNAVPGLKGLASGSATASGTGASTVARAGAAAGATTVSGAGMAIQSRAGSASAAGSGVAISWVVGNLQGISYGTGIAAAIGAAVTRAAGRVVANSNVNAAGAATTRAVATASARGTAQSTGVAKVHVAAEDAIVHVLPQNRAVMATPTPATAVEGEWPRRVMVSPLALEEVA